MSAAAIFWDRDGTLIPDPGYLRDPNQVELLPGAPEALRRLHEAGYQNIITTNQSGVARGLMDEATVERIHDRLRELLASSDATIDAMYYCPYLDGEEAVVEAYRQDSDLRKPRPGMLLKASLERNLDLAASWSIGDSLRDAQAGRAAGCRTILICTDPAESPGRDASVDFKAGSLADAVNIVLKHTPSKAQAPSTVAAVPVESVNVLQEILAFLRMVDRRNQAEEFSLARLAGALSQLMAIAALIWSIFGLIWDEALGVQIVRLLYALILQLMAITFFVLSSKK